MSLDWVRSRIDASSSAIYSQTIGKASINNNHVGAAKHQRSKFSYESKLDKATPYQPDRLSFTVTRTPTESADVRRMLNESRVLGSISRSVRQNTLTRHPVSHMPILPSKAGQPIRINRQRLPSLRRRTNEDHSTDTMESGSELSSEELLPSLRSSDLANVQSHANRHSDSRAIDNDSHDQSPNNFSQLDSLIPQLTPEDIVADFTLNTPHSHEAFSAPGISIAPSQTTPNHSVNAKLQGNGHFSAAQLKELSSLMEIDMPREKYAVVVRKTSSSNLFSTSETYEDTSKRSQKANVRLLDTVVYGSLFGNVMAMTNAGISLGSALPSIMILIPSLFSAYAENFGGYSGDAANAAFKWISNFLVFWN